MNSKYRGNPVLGVDSDAIIDQFVQFLTSSDTSVAVTDANGNVFNVDTLSQIAAGTMAPSAIVAINENVDIALATSEAVSGQLSAISGNVAEVSGAAAGASSYAGSAMAQANKAESDAQGASGYANSAYVAAGSAMSAAQSASSYAGSAYEKANQADADALGASGYAASAYALAASAMSVAEAASGGGGGSLSLPLKPANNTALAEYPSGAYITSDATGESILTSSLEVSGNITIPFGNTIGWSTNGSGGATVSTSSDGTTLIINAPAASTRILTLELGGATEAWFGPDGTYSTEGYITFVGYKNKSITTSAGNLVFYNSSMANVSNMDDGGNWNVNSLTATGSVVAGNSSYLAGGSVLFGAGSSVASGSGPLMYQPDASGSIGWRSGLGTAGNPYEYMSFYGGGNGAITGMLKVLNGGFWANKNVLTNTTSGVIGFSTDGGTTIPAWLSYNNAASGSGILVNGQGSTSQTVGGGAVLEVLSTSALASGAGSTLLIAEFSASDIGSLDKLQVASARSASVSGNTWTTAAVRLQRTVDATLMGYIQFGDQNGGGGNGGFGNGASTPHTTWDTGGNWWFGGRISTTSYITVPSAGSTIGTTASTATALSVVSSGSTTGFTVTDVGNNGANILLQGNGATTPNKTIRAQNGTLQITNSAYSAVIFTIDDAGDVTVKANLTVNGGTANVGGLSVGNGQGQIMLRGNGTTSTLDFVTANNSAYAAGTMQATSMAFNVGYATFNAGIGTSGDVTIPSGNRALAGAFQSTNTTLTPNTNPQTASFRAQGNYGGGFGMVDGSYGLGLYSVAGALTIGLGTSSSISQVAQINSAGTLSLNGNVSLANGNGLSWASGFTAAVGSGGATLSFNAPSGSTEIVGFSLNGSAQSYIDGGGGLVIGGTGGIRAGYNSGASSSVDTSNWFRSSGNVGWYNATYGIGIYALDTTYVRTYNNASMMAADFVLSSDRRLKTKIRPFEMKSRLKPVTYFHLEKGIEEDGFLSQDFQDDYPSMVGADPNNGMLNLSYSRTTVILAAQANRTEDALAELRREFEALRARYENTLWNRFKKWVSKLFQPQQGK
ncbi:MAG TPA: hypothetical protein VN081_04675 [Dongiaceae bacterium]|nr:hypothetical protein [Dongiaceae bacterium]